MKIKKVSIVIIFFAFLNLIQFLWYVNPIGFFGAPRVPDEETAIAIARAFGERLDGQSSSISLIFIGEYIEGRGTWLVKRTPPPRYYHGRSDIVVIRARDGRVIDFRIN